MLVPALMFPNLVQGAGESKPIVSAGAGGYLTSPPKPCKPLPETIYKIANLTGTTRTNQWWSSLVWQQFSQNMFPHPAVVRCDAKGLMVAYPGSHIHGNKTGIFGSADLQNGDFFIGHSQAREFSRADYAGGSDWFVTAQFSAESTSLQTTFGHGSPYIFCQYVGGEPQLTFGKRPEVWSGTAESAALGVTINGHHYGLFGPTGSTWTGLDTPVFRNLSGGKTYFSVAVLPDNRAETLATFARLAHSHVTDSRVSYALKEGKIITDYQFTCTPQEGSAKETLFALYPHQWKYSATPLTEFTYGSVRGTMKVGQGVSFQTMTPVQGLLPFLPKEGLPNQELIIGLLKEEAAKSPAGFADSYWEGKHLGTLASLSGVAEAAGATELQQQFLTELKRRLEQWFTATIGKEQPVFYYDAHWGTLVGSRPGYGSDNPLNDHHFHYGYFIRAAAEVARNDAAWAKEWGPMVDLIIRDIASQNRSDDMFPYLRCFDQYAGHSWASGDANFADGNNQESSSESLNAWYGLILWGEATGNIATRDLGLALYNTERVAVEEYWFDVSGTNYPADFPQVALGMVWGGKGAFGTWFSGEIDCIHGINWLPFTPASVTMGRHPDYVQKNHARIVAERKGGTDFETGWGDLVVMFGALYDPASAARYLDEHPRCKIESGNSRPFMSHWIHTFDQLGRINATITSPHPFTNIYETASQRTYAAYNFGHTPLPVTFSDGTQLIVPEKSLGTIQVPVKN
ncbi:MAG: glycosyl hydrolase [Planctomycetaceae bacterium]